MLDIWRMQSTPSLPSLPGSIWPKVVVLDRVLSMGLIELKSVHIKSELFEIELF